MKKDKNKYIIFAMSIIILYLFLCSIYKINQLEHENSYLREIKMEEDIELAHCYLCNGTVKINPVNESFYIECNNCKLRTDFFDSKNELILYWNRTNKMEKFL